jgi:hypothetical protein
VTTWLDSTHYKIKFACLTSPIELQNIEVSVSGLICENGFIQSSYTAQTKLDIDMVGPELLTTDLSSLLIAEASVNQPLTVQLTFNQECDTTVLPQINFIGLINPAVTFSLSAQSGWVSGSVYNAVFTVSDNNDDAQNLQINIFNVFDQSGNAMNLTTVNNSLTI